MREKQKRRSIVGWVAGLVLVMVQGIAMGQSMPSGSYQRTCKNVDVQDGMLTANCQDMDGRWEATQLRNYRSCGGDIMNDNGVLRCGNNGNGPVAGYQGGYQTGMPNGSYTQTCQEIRIHGDDLEARCQTTDGNWHKTKLDGFQRCRGDVANDNGTLRCVNGGYAPGGYQGDYRGGYPGGRVGGTYTQTCKDIKSHGDHLEARCKTMNGDWVNTSMDDYRKCHGEIINDNGNLRCVAGAGTGGYLGNVPPGSYTQTCQEVHVSGDELEARCQTANGDMRSSRLDDFDRCRGDIVNDDGHLRCAK